MNDSVESDALVMPSRSGSHGGRLACPRPPSRWFASSKRDPLHVLADQEVGVADVVDHAHLAQHLADDDLDVLVVDLHALEAVDLLHLVHQYLASSFSPLMREDVVRVRRAVHQRLAGAHPIALVHADVLALRDQVLARLADVPVRRHDHAALAA